MSKELNLKLFIDFLHEHNLYDLYNTYRYLNNQISLKLFIRNSLPQYYIDDAFKWAITSEGSDFWNDVNSKWIDLLNTEKRI